MGEKCSILVWGNIKLSKLVRWVGMKTAKKRRHHKVVGHSFSLDMEIQDVDWLLLNSVRKKLTYRCSTKSLLDGRVMIMNKTLFSTLWSFIMVQGGSKQVKSTCHMTSWFCDYNQYNNLLVFQVTFFIIFNLCEIN